MIKTKGRIGGLIGLTEEAVKQSRTLAEARAVLEKAVPPRRRALEVLRTIIDGLGAGRTPDAGTINDMRRALLQLEDACRDLERKP